MAVAATSMGLDDKGTQFLLAARRLGVSFERTATIGRQRLYVASARLRNGALAVDYGNAAVYDFDVNRWLRLMSPR